MTPIDTTAFSARTSLSKVALAQIYGLFALAMALTAVGVGLGWLYAPLLLRSGMLFLLLIAELGIIFTARLWSRTAPLNVILFVLFPLLSGITFTPYLLSILATYVNGASILLNATLATVFLAAAAALFAATTTLPMAAMGRFLLLGIIGLIGFTLVQIFVPALQVRGVELVVSGFAIVLFAAFTAYDVQRIQRMAMHATPFELALSLYLDIFNLFLSILRFMTALSGDRR